MTDRPMTADDFLRSVREARIEKRRCEYRLEEIRTQCEKVTANYGHLMPSGNGENHKDALLIAAAEQAEELTDRVTAYWDRVRLVEEFIGEMPDVRLRTILRLRYVDLLRWSDVHEGLREYGLYYEERTMYKLHGAALAEARRNFDGFCERHPEIMPNDNNDSEESEGDNNVYRGSQEDQLLKLEK